ncbi:MAG: inorganic phosphate transporter [Propionibacteriaceae bacterium]|nr:inorganic phosphate transporter [Propionibacteriaceae bacterium]
MALIVVIIVIITALVFDFTNGFHDSANAMATSVATGAFSPKAAVAVAAVLNFAGAAMSTEVAKTISHGLVDDKLVTPEAVFAGLAGAILWNLITWFAGLPSSSSHAMFGGLIGAVVAWHGMNGVYVGNVLSKILLPALVAPVVAGLASVIATKIAYSAANQNHRQVEDAFQMGQRLTGSLVALAHGTSDGQKTMGIITLVLVAGGFQEAGTGPHFWVICAAGAAIALGTYSGGWRIMRTMGKGLVEIEPTQGFACEASATTAILVSSHLGFGLSTTHVVTGAILGSGLGRGTKVNWSVAGRMGIAWLLTLPAAGLIGAFSSLIAHQGIVGFVGVLAVIVVLAGVIVWRANKDRIDHTNVNDIKGADLSGDDAPYTVKYLDSDDDFKPVVRSKVIGETTDSDDVWQIPSARVRGWAPIIVHRPAISVVDALAPSGGAK